MPKPFELPDHLSPNKQLKTMQNEVTIGKQVNREFNIRRKLHFEVNVDKLLV
jgi:hypothetical protein